MVIALSICTLTLLGLTAFLGAWVLDLRWRSRVQDQEIGQLRSHVERVAQDVIELYRGDRRRVLATVANDVRKGPPLPSVARRGPPRVDVVAAPPIAAEEDTRVMNVSELQALSQRAGAPADSGKTLTSAFDTMVTPRSPKG